MGFPLLHISNLPGWMFPLILSALIASVVLFLGSIVKNIFSKGAWPPFPALLVGCTGIILQIPNLTVLYFAKTYVIGLYHGAQYLVVGAAKASRPAEQPRNVFLLSYWFKMVMAGTFIYMVIPRIVEEYSGIPAAMSYPIIFTVFNFHHFILDATIWKLRHSEVRKGLLD
jgi:hypothetical protein